MTKHLRRFVTRPTTGKSFVAVVAMLVGLMTASPAIAHAQQCVYNNSGTSLNVSWYNASGRLDANASNSNLTVGMRACQRNANLGFAKIECNGCQWAAKAAKDAVIATGAGAYGVCAAIGQGGCLVDGEIAAATLATVQSIPPAFDHKLVVVPNNGQTVTVTGNVLGLNVE